MPSTLRLLAAFLLVALAVAPARAQRDDEARTEDEGEIVIERDGDVYRFRIPRFDGDHARPFRTDTVIDGRHVIRFRLPDGEPFEFEVPEIEGEAFRMHVLPELERLRTPPPGFLFDREGEPFGLLPFREHMDGLRFRFHGGASEETRREMMELEQRARELAEEARRADGRAREDAERALEDVLGELFEVRGRMREEQAARLEEQAEELRREAEELRQSLHERDAERRALIEERMRELLGERGSDW